MTPLQKLPKNLGDFGKLIVDKGLKKLPKNDFTRKMIDFDTFTKLPKNVGDLGKLIVAKGFEKLPKVQ